MSLLIPLLLLVAFTASHQFYTGNQTSGRSASFRVRYWLYTLGFGLYNLFWGSLTVLLPLLPFSIGPAFPLYEELYFRVSEFIPSLRTLTELENAFTFLSLLWLVWVVLGFSLGALVPNLLVNPFDYNRRDKGNWPANLWDRILNGLLRLRTTVDLTRYTPHESEFAYLNVGLNQDLRTRLAAFEAERWQDFRQLFRNPWRRRKIVEGIVLLFLIGCGIAGSLVVLQDPEYYRAGDQIDDFLLLTAAFGLIGWSIFVFKKHGLVRRAKRHYLDTEKITAYFLPTVKAKFKKQITRPLLQELGEDYSYSLFLRDDKVDKERVYTSPLFGLHQRPGFEKETLRLSDQLTLTHQGSTVYLADLKFVKVKEGEISRVELQGLYLETEFGEQFAGRTIITTKNNFYASRRYIRTSPDLNSDFVSESPDFNRQFTVFTDNQIEARLALKTNIMYNLLRLASLNRNVFVRLEANKAYLYLDSATDFFEYDYFAPRKLDSEAEYTRFVREYTHQITLPVVTSLLLNPRKLHRSKRNG